LSIIQHIHNKVAKLAVLVDPDKADVQHLEQLAILAHQGAIDIFLVGGSLLFTNHLQNTVDFLRKHTPVPVILFPGGSNQIYSGADAILLLSLISGRNPDFLIGRHVESAPLLRHSGLEIISTGYMLVDGGRGTTVSYISNTTPLLAHKPEIAAATAMAAEMLGMKCIYLEAGSGALQPVPTEVVKAVCASVNIPVITGGGIKTPEKAAENIAAGASLIVVGTAAEKDTGLIASIAEAVHSTQIVNK
jgi:putative glycerol-1-phosphate prenyltransferase